MIQFHLFQRYFSTVCNLKYSKFVIFRKVWTLSVAGRIPIRLQLLKRRSWQLFSILYLQWIQVIPYYHWEKPCSLSNVLKRKKYEKATGEDADAVSHLVVNKSTMLDDSPSHQTGKFAKYATDIKFWPPFARSDREICAGISRTCY